MAEHRPVRRVDERRLHGGGERHREQAGVVVDDVELLRAGEAGEHVLELSDMCPMCSLGATAWTYSSCAAVLRVARGEERDVDVALGEPSASNATTASVPPYAGGGTGNQGGAIIPTRRRRRWVRLPAATTRDRSNLPPTMEIDLPLRRLVETCLLGSPTACRCGRLPRCRGSSCGRSPRPGVQSDGLSGGDTIRSGRCSRARCRCPRSIALMPELSR